ncbi:hypothetical protein [Nocardia veterana]|uniref:Uncharacterized protein n=1 Tax=Nocardia veterana TaxID=132249 RepID=A0A7X6LW08_9NOCA|nr:hypothetical protein [Nocardia veterana]NKY85629.1 hypothetical protein [Nocardia veterana]
MATGVGLRIAEDECIAAIVTGGGDTDETSEPLFITRESVLHMSDDGDTALGGTAPPGHTHSITGFVRAIGDPAGIPVDDGEAFRAEDLFATAAFCLINLASDHLNGPAEFYAAHPADWPPEHVRGVREALDYLGLRSVVLVSEGDLPPADDIRGHAGNAARAALATVLATPAGATPPDPTPPDPAAGDIALVSTDVLPAVPASTTAQAYSAAVPVQTPTPEPAATVAATMAAPVTDTAPEPKKSRRTAILIAAAAALVGLALGGVAAAMMLRDDHPARLPATVSGAAEATTTVTTTVAAPAPPPPPPALTTVAPAPPETTTEPTTTTPPPSSSTSVTPTPTTTPETTTRTSPTTRTRTTTTTPDPLDEVPGFSWPTGVPRPWNTGS